MAEQENAGTGANRSNLALRIGLASALGLGAVVTGFILTRPGRRLMGDVLAGRKRTPLEGRVLDALWSDRIIGRRKLEVRETGPGRVLIRGTLRSAEEVGRAIALAEHAKGIKTVDSEIGVTAEGDPESSR